MAPRLDFTSDAFFRDPPRAIATLRMSGPVVAARFPLVGHVWITTTHEATAQILKDGTNFTLRKENGDVAGLRRWMPNYVRTIANNMLTMDEPDHTRLRSIVDEAFRRRAIVAMAPRIRAIADGLADELFSAGSPADLVQRYARILPLAVISELLGLPLADRPRFIAWANAMSSLTNVVSFFRLLFAFRKMRAYLERQLQIARLRAARASSRNWFRSSTRAARSRRTKWCRWCSCCSRLALRPPRTSSAVPSTSSSEIPASATG